MEAETAAAAARQRQEEVEEARAKASAAYEADALAADPADMTRKAEVAAAKAKAAREKANEAAEDAGLQAPDLEPLACDAMPRRGLARKAVGTPTRKTQRNFTDADSDLMESGETYLQGYNCQLAVDSDHQVIVAVGVSTQPPDVEHLKPMLERIAATAGALPEVMTLDAGYWSEDNAVGCENLGLMPTPPPPAARATRIASLLISARPSGCSAGYQPSPAATASAACSPGLKPTSCRAENAVPRSLATNPPGPIGSHPEGVSAAGPQPSSLSRPLMS
jgi:hypothetical protein